MKNHLSRGTSEIYTEIVKGLGETLVVALPGPAMSFITKRSSPDFPTKLNVVDFMNLCISDMNLTFRLIVPSKPIGLYSKQSIIFRSDSNAEDLEGYAGAGFYDRFVLKLNFLVRCKQKRVAFS